MPNVVDIKAREGAAKGVDRVQISITIRSYPDRVTNEETGEAHDGEPQNDAWLSSPRLEYEIQYVDGDAIQEDDTFVVVAYQNVAGTAITTQPEKGMEIAFSDGSVWQIMKVKIVAGSDTPAAWELQLRK